ncbi:GntR family transcriptional regulator [Chloroflexota bacterium]
MSATDLDLRIRVDRRPLYLLALEKLDALLEQGEYRAHDQLPPERELAELLGISRGTLREALRVAQQQGLIVQRHGAGTFVANPRIVTENGLAALESLDTLAARHGWDCQSLDVMIEERPLEAHAAKALDREVGSPATYVSRVKTINDQRVAYLVDICPAETVPIEEIQSLFEGSMLDLLRAYPGLTVDHAWCYILSVCADEEIADKMGMPAGRSLLLTEETVYSADQIPLEFSYNYFASDFFRFFIIRSL